MPTRDVELECILYRRYFLFKFARSFIGEGFNRYLSQKLFEIFGWEYLNECFKTIGLGDK